MPSVQIQVLPSYPGGLGNCPLPDDPRFLLPAMPGDAGIDLYAAERVVLRPGERVTVGTGLAFAVPAGYEMQVRPKSGLASKRGLTVLNSPGTVDAGYRDEVRVILLNTNPPITPDVLDLMFDAIDGLTSRAEVQEAYDKAFHDRTIVIARGDKIAQLVYAAFERPLHQQVAELPSSIRGTAGFGSTGT